jgi:hypothetical protein
MKLSGIRYLVLGAGLVLAAQLAPEARAQWWNTPANQPQTPAAAPPTRGENLSAKPAAQLFASDCTGAGCHKGPQGLAKDRGAGSLASFLREHYTNSRESAAAIAAYLVSVPGARGDPKQQPSRAAAKPDDKPAERKPPAAIPSATPGSETPEPQQAQPQQAQPQAKPAPAARAQRGRQATVTPAPPAAAPTPEPPAPPPEPPKPQWDIFD